eukprot:COSAG06_NODE_628_length_13649_cov_20.848930_16_plen_167_part_00
MLSVCPWFSNMYYALLLAEHLLCHFLLLSLLPLLVSRSQRELLLDLPVLRIGDKCSVKNFFRIRIALQRSQSHPLPMQRFDCRYKASKCNGAVQHSTAQHSTAQHSTAQHSTAQHSTAQHSTAQRSMRDFSSWYSVTVHLHGTPKDSIPRCCTRSLAPRVLTIVRL